ncbi:MAG TPA: hypothetical protein VEI83_04825 [Acidimicrobiales bacterium]|nr:hypothetical protein [Acidimicrobiales bacterium]
MARRRSWWGWGYTESPPPLDALALPAPRLTPPASLALDPARICDPGVLVDPLRP